MFGIYIRDQVVSPRILIQEFLLVQCISVCNEICYGTQSNLRASKEHGMNSDKAKR